MSVVLLWLGPVLEIGVLAGLARRGRMGRAWMLSVFLLAVLSTNLLVAIEPSFQTWRFWLFKEALHAVLLLALVIEVAWRMVRHLPGPALALSLLLLVLAWATGLVLREAPREHVLFEVIPRLLAGTAGLYIGAFLIQACFRIPVDPVHRAVLLGLSPWMLAYAVTWGRVTGADAVPVVGQVNAWMSAFALVVLLEAAWRREDELPVPRRLWRFLWPWRR